MNKNYFILALSLIVFTFSEAQQKDTIYGKVKSIREKVIFLTEIENPKLFQMDSDYGHSGFVGPKSTISRFKSTWYSTHFCYYINYLRRYNEKGQIIEDIWYDKKDSLENYFRYEYDNKDRLIRKIDSVKDYVYIDTHYYEDDRHETILMQNLDFDLFVHRYKRYDENKKVIREKSINQYGILKEYIFKYNDNGKLLYRIYKNPYSYKKVENGWSWGVQDTIGNIYKDIVNIYDESDRLIEQKRYELNSDGDHKGTILKKHKVYKYKNNNLIQEIDNFSSKRPYYVNYEYDKENRITKKYYYLIEESDVKRIEKYDYKNDNIISLIYTGIIWPSKESTTYKIEFHYTFDDKGNWSEILKKVDSKELYKWIREIEYFE